MRTCVLVLLFARGGFSGGGVFNHQQATLARDPGNTIKQQRKRSGAEGSPLYAQLLTGELPPPVYQPKPRYVAPMHRPNLPAVLRAEQDEEWRRQQMAQTPVQKTGGYDWTKEGHEKYQHTDDAGDGRRFRPGWEWK
jgi:hypothetical protein